MTTTPTSSNHPRQPAGRYVEILAAGATLLVLHTGLIPYEFGRAAGGGGSQHFLDTSTSRFTEADIVSNIFLYLPIGALVFWAMRNRARGALAAILGTLAAGAALSLVVEWAQSYIPVRVSSAIDLVCNIIGTALGIAASYSAQALVRSIVRASLDEFRHRRRTFIAKACCALLIIGAAMPFSFSLDGGLLKQSLRMVTLVPFGAFEQLELEASDALARDDDMTLAYARWASLKLLSRWAVETATFVVFGCLVATLLTAEFGFRRISANALTIWLGLLMAIGLSAIQLPIISRDLDVTDILFRLLGCAMGVSYVSFRSRANKGQPELAHQFDTQRVARLGCSFVLGYIVYTGLIPFLFDPKESGFSTSVASSSFLPFFGYFVTRFDLMMDDVIEKSVAYLALGVFLAALQTERVGPLTRGQLARIAAIGVIVAVPIEFVQMYMPVRIASLTDPLIAAVGCALGASAYQHVVVALRTSELAGYQSDAASESLPADVQDHLSALDELLGTLSEPHPDAPVEPSPVRPLARRP